MAKAKNDQVKKEPTPVQKQESPPLEVTDAPAEAIVDDTDTTGLEPFVETDDFTKVIVSAMNGDLADWAALLQAKAQKRLDAAKAQSEADADENAKHVDKRDATSRVTA